MDQRAARVRDAVERLDEVGQPRKWQLRIAIQPAAPSPTVVVSLDSVVVGHADFSVGPVTGQVLRGDRVALVGANGSGKTTLLQALLGERPVASGRISWGTRVHLGVLDQARAGIAGERPLLDEVAAALGETDAGARPHPAGEVRPRPRPHRPTLRPSHAGQYYQAVLALLQGRAVNVLVLDEPTNHLDVAAIDRLTECAGRSTVC